MKPCSDKQKYITLLALDELDVRQARELRTHIQYCEGCRHYLEEISRVTETLAAAETSPEIQVSDSFHKKVVARLQAEESVSLWETVRIYLRVSLLNWRVALPVIVVSVLMIVGLVVQQQQHGVGISVPTRAPVQIISAPDENADMPPTIANYEMVANQSLQKLDNLLTQQANKALPSAPIYTASMLSLANASQ